jgi:hypothetical protein
MACYDRQHTTTARNDRLTSRGRRLKSRGSAVDGFYDAGDLVWLSMREGLSPSFTFITRITKALAWILDSLVRV